MNSLRTLLLLLAALTPVCRAQVIISEFMADNVSSAFVDEDGAHEDWIELQNLGTSSVSLNGWYLTDEAGTDAARTGADLRKWQFPVTSPVVTLTAAGTTNSRLVVWCSSKNRKANVGTPTAPRLHTNFKLNNGGEHLALVRPDGVTVEHEIGQQFANFQYPPQPPNYTYGTVILTAPATVMPEGAAAKYLVPTEATDIPAGWNAAAFDDSTWTSATSGIGYGFPSPTYDIVVNGSTVPLIATDISAAMAGKKSAFVRFPFNLANAAGATAVRLKVRHDDGYVCYLNGVQLGSANSPTPLLWDSAATGNKTDSGVTTVVTTNNTTNGPGALVAGTNVIAFQLLNSSGGGGEPDNVCLRPTLEIDLPSGFSIGYFSSATLGTANSGTSNGIGPDIADVTQNPLVLPTGGVGSAPIKVTAKVRQTLRPLATSAPVTLKWRRMWGTEASITMLDDGQSATSGDTTAGDGIYSALVPTTSLAAGEMIRWRVEARDNGATPTYAYAPPYPDFLTNNLNSPPANPPPSGIASKDIAQYYGTMASASTVLQHTQLPVLYWFIKSGDSNSVVSGGNATCSMFYRGRFYDNVYVERHGQSSAGFPTSKKSFNFNFTKDNRMEWSSTAPNVRSFNLLTNYADKTKMRTPTAWKFWSETGQLMSHWTETVRVHQITDANSTNVANHFWGIYDIVEDGNEDMLQRYGFSQADALYKIYDAMMAVAQAEQKTREDVDATKADYQALLNGLDTTKALSLRRSYSYDNVDIAAIVNSIAVHGILVSADWGHKNFYLFRNTNGTGDWSFVPWDQDLSIGHTWVGAQAYFNDEIDSQRGVRNGSTNRLKQVVYDSPEMNKMIVRRVRSLIDQYLGSVATPQSWFETQFAARQNQMDPPGLPGGAKSDAQLDFEKWGFWVHAGGGTTIAYTDSQAASHTMRAQASRLVNPFTSVQAAPWNYPGYVTGGNLGSNTTHAWLTGRRRYLYNLDGQNPGSGSDPIPAAQNNPAAGQVVFEAVDFKPTSGNGEQEFFCLRNNMPEYLDVSGWRITGTGGVTVDSADYVFRGGTVIPPFTSGTENIGRLFVARNPAQFRLRSISPKAGEFCYVVGPYNGRLSARGGGLELRNRNNVVVASTTWSANPTPSQNYLRITELNFRPAPATAGELALVSGLVAGDFEFIELVNGGPTVMNLSNASFDKGVTFTFPSGFTLNPLERCVVVASQTAFETRYGTGFKIAGEFEGSLDNSGETLRIMDAAGEEVLEFTYDDDWFPLPSGQYRSLVTRGAVPAYNQYEAPTTWALSSVQNGSPTGADGEPSRVFEGWRWDHFSQAEIPAIGGLTADPEGDGLNNFAEFAFGRLPKVSDRPAELATGGRMNVGGADYLTISFRRARNALDVNYIVEANDNLSNPAGWAQVGILVSATNLLNGTEDVIYRDSVPVGETPRFIRVRAAKP